MPEKFVYRKEELKKLQEAYGLLDEEGGQIRFIVGESGTGKSIVLKQFVEWLVQERERTLTVSCSCTMSSRKEEFGPFRDVLQSIVEELGVVEEEKRERKEKWVRVFGASADLLLKVAPDLVRTFVPMGNVIASIGGKVIEESGVSRWIEKQKAVEGVLPDILRLSDQYIEMIKMIARQYRLVICMDNLQWVDRSSLELLQHLQVMIRKIPVMLVGCYRGTDMVYMSGEEREPLETFVTRVKVEQGDVFVDLDAKRWEEKEQLTEELLRLEGGECDRAYVRRMVRKTGGNPLFIRELMKRKGEGCPVRIQGVIREKIAVLETVKLEVLRCAAVEGQRFLLQVVSRITGLQESELLEWLTEELGKQRHLVYEGEYFRQGGEMISAFYFSDIFLRDYLYGELSGSRRMVLHGKVARILEDLYVGREEEICRELERHYELSGEPHKALYYLEMCVRCAERNADYEAMVKYAEKGYRMTEKREWQMRWVRGMRKWGQRITEVLPAIEDGSGEFFWEEWHMKLQNSRWEEGRKVAEVFASQGERYGKLALGIMEYWQGNFMRCRELLRECEKGLMKEGEEFYLIEIYRVLAAFQSGEYEEAEEISLSFCKRVEGKGNEAWLYGMLIKVWLAFLDEDKESMLSVLKETERVEGKSLVKNWLCFFDWSRRAEVSVWEGLEKLEQKFGELERGYGVTLYGVAVCRLCLTKGLYEVFEREWVKVMKKVRESGEGAYLGELYLLRKRCLEAQGKEAEECDGKVKEWFKKRFNGECYE